MKPKVVIAGGGAAGMAVALRLERLGVEPVIVEREERLGGKVRGWHKLFPTFTPAAEVLDPLVAQIGRRGIECRTGAAVEALSEHGVKLASGQTIEADAVVVATGFTLFDARRKEEYGYGIYDNVVTSADLERMMNEGAVRLADGSTPRRIALLHCVGSRDEKVCQRHCSKVCCITGVKQAIELKKMFPEADVFNFYMDIRMFGAGYEELYREAQQSYNIHFVRGRISEASPMINGRAGRLGRARLSPQRLHAVGRPVSRCGAFASPRHILRRRRDGTQEPCRHAGRGFADGRRRNGLSQLRAAMSGLRFGYGINRPRAIDIDSNDLRKSNEILREMPELQTCIGCGSCTASCTAGNLTEFNFRRVHTLVRRGEYRSAYEEMNKCMLCGKCRLVCPRGINTRGVAMLIKRKLGDF